MLVIRDAHAVTHVVYNQREIRAYWNRGTDGWIERWQVLTICSPHVQLALLAKSIRRIDVFEAIDGPHVTCIRCVVGECDHGITFDAAKAASYRLTASEVRKRWPRLDGECPKGCGYCGIYYAGNAHYRGGNW